MMKFLTSKDIMKTVTMQLFVIQLTLEQHGFELCRSTYRRTFSTVNTIVLHDPWLVESMDAK